MSDKSSQKGMTLVEVLIACTITAVIIGGLSVAIYTITSVTGRGNADSYALHDIQKAAYWVSKDAQMARTTDLADGGPAADSVTLEWVDGDGNPHSSRYCLSGTELQRNYDGTVTSVAWYISSIEFSISDDVLTFGAESTPPRRWQVSRQTTGRVCLRARAGE